MRWRIRTEARRHAHRSRKCWGWRAARWASAAGGRPRCVGRGGSWPPTSEEALARIRDVSHQIRCCLQIPVRVGDLAVAEVRRQRQHMFCNSITSIRAGFQSPYGERVPQGMDRGAWKACSTREADLLGNVVECGFGVMQKQWAPPQGNEYVIIQGSIGAPPLEVLLHAGLRSLVKGNETAFTEL